MGPTSSMSLRDVPEEEDADASNTTCTLVVLLDFLYMACIGIYKSPVRDQRHHEWSHFNEIGEDLDF